MHEKSRCKRTSMQVVADDELQPLVPTLCTELSLALAISPLPCSYLVFLLFQDPMPVDAHIIYDFLHISVVNRFDEKDT